MRVKGLKMAQNDKRILSNSVSQELYFIWLWFLVHMCKMMISPAIFFQFFQNSDFWGFSKFVNKCHKEILRCAPFFTCMWFFFSVTLSNLFRNFICNIMLPANWQESYIHTYQICFQMFHFPIANCQFPSMSSKLVDMCRSTEVGSQDDNLWNSFQNLFWK